MKDNECKNTPAWVVIPDVHGRQFWADAVDKYPDADIVFLGDYLDPYPVEGISPGEALTMLAEIITFAKMHPRCQLLLGNHDLHYLCNFGEACRLDYANSQQIHFLLSDNLWLFRIAALREVGGKKVLLSHAPVLTPWLEAVGETDDPETLVQNINSKLAIINSQPWEVEQYLGQISSWRGGYDCFGSPVWADVREVDGNILPTVDYSIFGHTQLRNEPIITPTWACLDCRRAFLVTDDLEMLPI